MLLFRSSQVISQPKALHPPLNPELQSAVAPGAGKATHNSAQCAWSNRQSHLWIKRRSNSNPHLTKNAFQDLQSELAERFRRHFKSHPSFPGPCLPVMVSIDTPVRAESPNRKTTRCDPSGWCRIAPRLRNESTLQLITTASRISSLHSTIFCSFFLSFGKGRARFPPVVSIIHEAPAARWDPGESNPLYATQSKRGGNKNSNTNDSAVKSCDLVSE
ncbi:uncharacterized protein BJX67DRAFT_269306 [Aspergillus lucknowensis]|uniref:Uncharacterized protein n=1 Tax=Aspergillus lucknowensis TaxID=176173 RepID=A0ABR4LI53_9EURO